MTNTLTIRLAATIATLFALSSIGCSGNEACIPTCGEVSYEVTYSNDLRSDETFGSFLPHNLSCVYDSTNILMQATAPFGFARVAFVVGDEDKFAAIDFDNAKIIVSIEDLLGKIYSDSANRNFEVSEDLTDISGFMSTRVSARLEDNNTDATSLDLFFIPFGECKERTHPTDINTIDLSHWPRQPGLLTALNLNINGCNIMLVIKDFKHIDSVDHNVFERPCGYIEASQRDILAMRDLMMN